MYRFKIYYPGRTKSKFINEGINHYLKLLRPFAKVELIELKEAKGESLRVIDEESKNILNAVEGPFFLLHREGKMVDSIEFAEIIKNQALNQFIIGGAYGVNNLVIDRAQICLSLSKLTFTHEMSRLILLEQIYRAMTIINNRKYHY